MAAMSDDVVAVRSLSKVVAPGLRIGCVIAPSDLMQSLEQLRGGTDICASPLNQLAVARFLADGGVGPQIRRLSERFAKRRDAMLDGLSRHFSDLGAEWSRPDGGMFLWMRLREGVDTAELLEPAIDEGVAFVPGSVFSIDGDHRSSMRLCFASAEPERIEEGIRRLRATHDRIVGAGQR